MLAVNVVVLGALEDYAWYRFVQVFRWGLLAFTVARFETRTREESAQ